MVCRVRMKKCRSCKGEVGEITPNLLNRDFHDKKPIQSWSIAVTEFSLLGQKLYLSPILDLHNEYLANYIVSDRSVLRMVTTMLTKAFATISDGTDRILYSDQSLQYQRIIKAEGPGKVYAVKAAIWIVQQKKTFLFM